MITLTRAKTLKHGDILHHLFDRNSDGTSQRWRVNGKVKTWKRDIGRISVPVKHGLYDYSYLTESDLGSVQLIELCPFRLLSYSTKREKFELYLDNFDYALPQDWLDDFTVEYNLDYGLVLNTTVWCYDGSIFGYPVTCCTEVQDALNQSNR